MRQNGLFQLLLNLGGPRERMLADCRPAGSNISAWIAVVADKRFETRIDPGRKIELAVRNDVPPMLPLVAFVNDLLLWLGLGSDLSGGEGSRQSEITISRKRSRPGDPRSKIF